LVYFSQAVLANGITKSITLQDVLLERMEAQYRALQNTLREELEQIEKSFVEERSEMIDNNVKDIESLFTQRRENERLSLDFEKLLCKPNGYF
jgi:dynein regulatory complex protein 1